MQMSQISNIGIATVFLIITGGYIYLGYNIWEQSGQKYGHDVEDMRKTIMQATLSIACTCVISAIFFYIQGGVYNNISLSITRIITGKNNFYECFYPTQIFAGIVIV